MSQSSSLTSTSNRLKLSVSQEFTNKQITADEISFKEGVYIICIVVEQKWSDSCDLASFFEAAKSDY